MNFTFKSIRTFIGSKDFQISRQFYQKLGFEEIIIDAKMSYFKVNDNLGFYLQDYYVKDWVNNSMIFLEVENIEKCYQTIIQKELDKHFKDVRITDIKDEAWGSVFFVHDPVGVLWHFGCFK